MQTCARCLWRDVDERRPTASFVLVFGHTCVNSVLQQHLQRTDEVIAGFSAYCKYCRGVHLLQARARGSASGSASGRAPGSASGSASSAANLAESDVDNLVHTHIRCQEGRQLHKTLLDGTVHIV